MKKTLAMILAVIMLSACCAPALAQKADLSYVKSNPSLFEVETIDGFVYVTSAIPAIERAFTHKYESEALYSCTHFLLMLVNYGTNWERSACLLHIYYSSEQGYQNIESVSFIIDGDEYLFTDISQVIRDYENGTYTEVPVISFVYDNLPFLVALEAQVNIALEQEDPVEWFAAHPVIMVLHGKEDITVELDTSFYLDFLAMKIIIQECVDVNETMATRPDGTPLTVKEAE